MPKEMIDARKLLTGRNGELYDEEGNFLAMVNTFQAQVNISNVDYRPAGEAISVAVFDSYSVTLTFQETVIKDAILLKKLVDALKAKKQLLANFQGVVRGHDATEQRMVFRSCVPDGAIDLQNIQPGDILNRAWSWRVNEAPDLQKLLG